MATSRGELKIEDILKANNVWFEREYVFPDLISSSGRPLRFDFAIFDDDGDIDFLIEFQGEQHYVSVDHFGGARKLKSQQYNDTQKRRYCYNKNIPLVIIPYWDYEKIDYEYLYTAADRLRDPLAATMNE